MLNRTELSRAQRLLQALNGASLCPQRRWKPFFLFYTFALTLVLMQQQQICRLPFALLWNPSPHYRCLRDGFIFILMHLRTAGKHLRLFKNTACCIIMSRWIPHTCMISNHTWTSQQVVLVLQMPDRSGSGLIWACYQQYCGCSCKLIRKGKQIRLSLFIRCRSYYACAHVTAVASSL